MGPFGINVDPAKMQQDMIFNMDLISKIHPQCYSLHVREKLFVPIKIYNGSSNKFMPINYLFSLAEYVNYLLNYQVCSCYT